MLESDGIILISQSRSDGIRAIFNSYRKFGMLPPTFIDYVVESERSVHKLSIKLRQQLQEQEMKVQRVDGKYFIPIDPNIPVSEIDLMVEKIRRMDKR